MTDQHDRLPRRKALTRQGETIMAANLRLLGIGPENRRKPTCGATTRQGNQCQCKALYANGRCKFHGGLSTGPKTAEGKARSLANLQRGRQGNPITRQDHGKGGAELLDASARTRASVMEFEGAEPRKSAKRRRYVLGRTLKPRGQSSGDGPISNGLDYASSLGEVAAQLGVTTTALQEYRFAGSQAGLTTEEVDQALGQLTRRIGEGLSGTKAQAEAFAKLGVSLKDAKGNVVATGDAIPLIADGLLKLQSPAERAAVLMDLFGKSGQKLEPLLSGGSKAVNELREASQRLGYVLSSEQIQRADIAADKLGEVKKVLEAQIAGTVADNAESIVALANALAKVVGVAGKAIGAINELYKVAANNRGNLFEKISGINFSTGAPVRSRDFEVGRRETASGKGVGRDFVRRVSGGSNFAGNGLAGILGASGLNAIQQQARGSFGSGTGMDVKSIGGMIDTFSKPADQVAKQLSQWALELERVTADAALARARLSGSPDQILAAEKSRIRADQLAEESRIPVNRSGLEGAGSY